MPIRAATGDSTASWMIVAVVVAAVLCVATMCCAGVVAQSPLRTRRRARIHESSPGPHGAHRSPSADAHPTLSQPSLADVAGDGVVVRAAMWSARRGDSIDLSCVEKEKTFIDNRSGCRGGARRTIERKPPQAMVCMQDGPPSALKRPPSPLPLPEHLPSMAASPSPSPKNSLPPAEQNRIELSFAQPPDLSSIWPSPKHSLRPVADCGSPLNAWQSSSAPTGLAPQAAEVAHHMPWDVEAASGAGWGDSHDVTSPPSNTVRHRAAACETDPFGEPTWPPIVRCGHLKDPAPLSMLTPGEHALLPLPVPPEPYLPPPPCGLRSKCAIPQLLAPAPPGNLMPSLPAQRQAWLPAAPYLPAAPVAPHLPLA